MQPKSDKKIIVAVLVTIFVVLILSWLVIFLLGSKTRDSFENFQKEKLNSFVLEEKRNKILKLKREFSDLEDERNSLDSMLIKKDMAVPFLRALEKVAGDTSCQIKIEPADINKIRFEKKVSSPAQKKEEDDSASADEKDEAKDSEAKNKKVDDLAPLRSFPTFSVEVTGRFSPMVDFFEKIENMSYFVHPLVIDISADDKKNTAAANAGALPTGIPALTGDENLEGKILKMTMTFVVYGE
ncbi:MAG: hypothetical protein A2359_04460 [Candidatus Moranbacteria bacterium RIFOXYB1_FULL_43_19]|nr:MAG: hypothetical protein A2359_04460 [Candidatus Moranbacteria bacterium RIFOXYB1_FULL_43_19]OGI28782.1 MAG: hypothetical protein A2184_01950 [Candidatus Moranbacteria bacterium RIFOXYA1_FULL_44_7]OGI33130.1 MAG: hypothetical protein A2420_05700 [Candidatus Moranbacteria bacterium RIFOXYC1_FULL_44_13]OGI38665.1 MAG: hypothetical protein A2612_00395 [Candidatus Moranbacteria bacterium RIFOXYD1_FULL_44_12]